METVVPMALGPLQTNAFIIPTGEQSFFIVDAPLGCWGEVQERQRRTGERCAGLLLTHGHWDHIVEVADFNAAGIPVTAHPGDRDWIENPSLMADFLPFYLDLRPGKIDQWVEDGETIQVGQEKVEILLVPGHAPGNICFYFPIRKEVFAGDALFQGSVGRYDLPRGDGKLLLESIRKKLLTLPPETVVYPGHGPETTIGFEQKNNPFLQSF